MRSCDRYDGQGLFETAGATERKRRKRRRKEKKRCQRLLPRFLSVSRDKVQLPRKEGSEYAGQVAAEWPTKFWERVKSGLCLSGRVKKRILSSGTLVA